MATTPAHDHTDPAATKEYNGAATGHDHHSNDNMSHEEHQTAKAAARYGYGPLVHGNNQSSRLPAFGGDFQTQQVSQRKFANPAPLGLCAFALTTFVLSLINMRARHVAVPNIVVALAFGYGGLVQLLAGMWEMAIGNTFGATALSSYGGFWIAFGIVLTPGGFEIEELIIEEQGLNVYYDSFGLFLIGWFIFTLILTIFTLRSSVAFFLLFFFLDLAFMLLAIGYLSRNDADKPNPPIIKAGGFFGLLAAFMAWYNAMAGLADNSNSFFLIPLMPFPWSVTGMERKKTPRETV